MLRSCLPALSDRRVSCRRLLIRLLAPLTIVGCSGEAKIDYKSVSEPPAVRLIHPTVRNIVRVVSQPSFIESYERTSIYPKVTGYIEKWNVDIGDKVKKGELLATLFVPELVEDYRTKTATVTLDKDRVTLSKKLLKVAVADVKSAKARLVEAKAILDKYQADVDRWTTEEKRLKRETARGIVDPQILLETQNQMKSSVASRDSADATVVKADAELQSKEASRAAAETDVTVAVDDLAVADSQAKYAKAWVDYLKLTAPYDGVIVARNANTGDFVLPATGDPTAMARAPHLSPGGTAAPIYVVDRTDVVRIFVDVPELDADYVDVGTKATVLARAYRDEEIPAKVTRTSWALNIKSRTLRAEIDLPNPGGKLLPGMYAYAEVVVERPGVKALPIAALTFSGDQTFYWGYKNGKAVRQEIETGVSDDDWIEVTHHRIPDSSAKHAHKIQRKPIKGSELVILGDLSLLTENAPVRVEPVATASSRKSPRTKE